MAKDSSMRGRPGFRNVLGNEIGSLLLILLFGASGLYFSRRVNAAQGDDAHGPSKASERTKIAEGEYAIYEEGNGGAVGPFGEEVYDFHESWTLWKTPQGRFEIEGERKFRSPGDVEHKNRFSGELSRDLTAIRMTEFAPLKWRPDSGPVSCEFLPKELHCFSEARDPKKSADLRVPLDRPFAVFLPIAPFSLSGLTREAERDSTHVTPVQLVSIEQPNQNDAVRPMILSGELQYVGQEKIQAAGQEWNAYKFSLKVPFHQRFLIWASTKGILLALAFEHTHANWPKEGIKLMRFKNWADFGPN
jgi:hypothetical protein